MLLQGNPPAWGRGFPNARGPLGSPAWQWDTVLPHGDTTSSALWGHTVGNRVLQPHRSSPSPILLLPPW